MSRAAHRTAACALALGLVTSACVRVNWSRTRWQTPPPAGVGAATIEVGSSLTDVLALLGAPLVVREHRRDWVVLTYGWDVVDNKGANISVPVSEQFSLSLDLRDNRTGARGLLLFFDPELRLSAASEGWLENPRDNVRPRRPSLPASITDTEAS